MRLLRIIMVLTVVSLVTWSCSSGVSSAEVDKKLKAANAKNLKFQQMAAKKISSLEKDVKALKKSQSKLSKQIPVIVKQIKILKKAIAESGKGVSPAMEAQLEALVTSLEAMEQELALVKEQGPLVQETEEQAPPILIKGSDQERIYRQYGDPIERYLVDDKNQVWLYDNGVAVFDMNGRIVSIEFK